MASLWKFQWWSVENIESIVAVSRGVGTTGAPGDIWFLDFPFDICIYHVILFSMDSRQSCIGKFVARSGQKNRYQAK